MKRTKTRKTSTGSTIRIPRIPPTSDAARDEGPRLIPLAERPKEPSRLEHYLDLADIALGAKDSSKKNG